MCTIPNHEEYSMSTVQPSTQSFFSSTLEYIETPLIAVRDFVTPPLKFVAERIQNIWNFFEPYLASAGKFLTSKLGISLELLCLSIIPLQLSRTVDNKILSIALLAAGVLIAGAGGFILCSSGAISSFLPHVTPVVAV